MFHFYMNFPSGVSLEIVNIRHSNYQPFFKCILFASDTMINLNSMHAYMTNKLEKDVKLGIWWKKIFVQWMAVTESKIKYVWFDGTFNVDIKWEPLSWIHLQVSNFAAFVIQYSYVTTFFILDRNSSEKIFKLIF